MLLVLRCRFRVQCIFSSSVSPESGIADTSGPPLSYVDQNAAELYEDTSEYANNGAYNDMEPFPVLGTGSAIYTFDGQLIASLSHCRFKLEPFRSLRLPTLTKIFDGNVNFYAIFVILTNSSSEF